MILNEFRLNCKGTRIFKAITLKLLKLYLILYVF
jgi:hypothetical protein